MSEHDDVESSEAVLFLLECDKHSDPWEKAASCFGEGFRLGELPQGSGGKDDVGEQEKTSAPLGLQLRLLCAGIGILGDGTTVGKGLAEHPLETNTQWEMSSEDEQEGVRKNCRKCYKGCETDMYLVSFMMCIFITNIFFDSYNINPFSKGFLHNSGCGCQC